MQLGRASRPTSDHQMAASVHLFPPFLDAFLFSSRRARNIIFVWTLGDYCGHCPGRSFGFSRLLLCFYLGMVPRSLLLSFYSITFLWLIVLYLIIYISVIVELCICRNVFMYNMCVFVSWYRGCNSLFSFLMCMRVCAHKCECKVLMSILSKKKNLISR